MSKYDGEPVPTTALEAVTRQRNAAQREEKFLRRVKEQLEARIARRRLIIVEVGLLDDDGMDTPTYQIYERQYTLGATYYSPARFRGENEPVAMHRAIKRLARMREGLRLEDLGVKRGTESFDMMMRQWERKQR